MYTIDEHNDMELVIMAPHDNINSNTTNLTIWVVSCS